MNNSFDTNDAEKRSRISGRPFKAVPGNGPAHRKKPAIPGALKEVTGPKCITLFYKKYLKQIL